PATDFYPLSLHDALPISRAEADVEWLKAMVTALRRIRSELGVSPSRQVPLLVRGGALADAARLERFSAQLRFLGRLDRIETILEDRKSTRLNSSHVKISY